MRKLFTLFSLLVIASLALAACGGADTAAPSTGGEGTQAPSTGSGGFTSKDPTTFVAVSFGEPDLLDPALDYETAGGEVLQNVYETLVTYKGNYLSEFEPLLAESYEVSEDGTVYSFKLHQGIKFHDGADLTASDITYSFVRGMLQGGGSSPQFLIVEPFYGVGASDISEAVEVADTIRSLAVDEDGLTAEEAEGYGIEAPDGLTSAEALAQIFGVEVPEDSEGPMSPEDAVQLGLSAISDGLSGDEIGANPGNLYDNVEAMKEVDPAILVGVCEDLYSKFETDDAAGTVNMKLALPWAPFISTIAGYWSAAMDQDWVAANGGWDGSCETWQDFYAMQPENDPIYDIANGTGPFILDHWTPGEEIVLVRNDNYWREPAKLERVVLQNVTEWSTRFAMMQAGDADWVTVPPENRTQMDALVGETCNWDAALVDYVCEVTDETKPLRVTLGRSGNTRSDIFFNFNVANPDGSNTYLGSGKLDGNGITPDFFGDVHIRKAFNYCFDWDTYIADIFNGEAVQSKSLAIEDMPGYNDDDPTYFFDLAKCEEEFKLADADKDGIPAGEDPEGDIWTTGFRLSGTYNQGNTTRQTLVEMLSLNVNTVNDKFIIESVGLPWPAFLRSINAKLAPLFFVGWHEDIHDPHNWYVPYLVTFYANRQSIDPAIKAQFVPLVNAGVLESDPAKRNEIYKELNQLVYDNAPGIIGVLATSHGFMPRYVKGIQYNQNYSNFYYYPMFEE